MLVASAGALMCLMLWGWSVKQSLDEIEKTQERLLALEDSLRSTPVSEARVQAIERRIERIEKDIARGSRIVRAPEVIALRRWVRRLDQAMTVDRQRLDAISAALDSSRGHSATWDSVKRLPD